MSVFDQTGQSYFLSKPKKKKKNYKSFTKSKYYIYNILIRKTMTFELNSLSLNVKKQFESNFNAFEILNYLTPTLV